MVSLKPTLKHRCDFKLLVLFTKQFHYYTFTFLTETFRGGCCYLVVPSSSSFFIDSFFAYLLDILEDKALINLLTRIDVAENISVYVNMNSVIFNLNSANSSGVHFQFLARSISQISLKKKS